MNTHKQYNNIDEWKADVASTSHKLKTDTLSFTSPDKRYSGEAWVVGFLVPNGLDGPESWRSITIGGYETITNKGGYYP